MGQPILQLVHYSDLHIVGPRYLSQRKDFQQALQWLPAGYQQGVEGHDHVALKAFEDFLRNEISNNPDWKNCDTWLVDTGDGTTFGDDESLDEWLNVWTKRFINASPTGTKLSFLYGNHDAWPQTFPLCAPFQIQAHRQALRAKWFRQVWPMPPFRVVIPNAGGSEIQLYVLNTVNHDLWPNTFARGEALPDRHWENPRQTIGPTAGADLKRIVDGYAGAPIVPHLRILALHYPVSDAASQGALYQKVLANGHMLADELKAPTSSNSPLAHLLISGHTHVGFPVAGLLPNSAHSATHTPLGPGQCQLVVGTLSQARRNPPKINAGYYPDECLIDFPYQCQVLRFSNSPTTPREITVQRLIAGCPPGGSFEFLPIAENSDRIAEDMTLVI